LPPLIVWSLVEVAGAPETDWPLAVSILLPWALLQPWLGFGSKRPEEPPSPLPDPELLLEPELLPDREPASDPELVPDWEPLLIPELVFEPELPLAPELPFDPEPPPVLDPAPVEPPDPELVELLELGEVPWFPLEEPPDEPADASSGDPPFPPPVGGLEGELQAMTVRTKNCSTERCRRRMDSRNVVDSLN
jgi:hypothetical protein